MPDKMMPAHAMLILTPTGNPRRDFGGEGDAETSGEKLTSADETLIEARAKDGEIVANNEEIDAITVDFDLADFEALAKDKEGDKVVVVMTGTVARADDDEASVDFTHASVIHGKLGDGSRFKKLESALSNRPGVKDPAALAAAIGRKKYGAARMAKWSAAGRKGG